MSCRRRSHYVMVLTTSYFSGNTLLNISVIVTYEPITYQKLSNLEKNVVWCIRWTVFWCNTTGWFQNLTCTSYVHYSHKPNCQSKIKGISKLAYNWNTVCQYYNHSALVVKFDISYIQSKQPICIQSYLVAIQNYPFLLG